MASRRLEGILPAAVVYWLLWPTSSLRALRPTLTVKRMPVRRLPADMTDRPGLLRRWRYNTNLIQRWQVMVWADRWRQPRWRERMRATNEGVLEELARQRPLIIVTLHTVDLVILGAWLAHRGLAVGSIILGQPGWERAQASRQAIGEDRFDWSAFASSTAFLAGDTRSMLRFLSQPGRCLLLPADHLQGKTVDGAWAGGRLRLSRGPFRLARHSAATVVPVLVSAAGRWRFDIHLGTPVPDELISAGDEEAAASHVAGELMPLAAARPFEAMLTLVEAVLPPEGSR